MTIARTYRCPGTATHPPHEFVHLHHPSIALDPLPRFCSRCGFDSEGDELEQPLAAPHIAKTIRATVDNMHREMEAGAEFRAAMAQETLGMDAEGAAAMRMTDMKDGLREGDTSDMPVSNPVSQFMEAAPPGTVGFQGANGVGWSGPVSEGASPNAGAHAQKALRQAHAQFTAGTGMAGATTSSMPALETMAPSYRKRVR